VPPCGSARLREKQQRCDGPIDRHEIREVRSEPWRCPTRRKGVSVMLLTRSRLREQLTRRLRRSRSTAVPILQAAAAAGLSWLVAVHIVEHRAPFFAPVAAVVCLGLTLGERLRRAIELIVWIALGIGIGDLLISAIGTGSWKIALIVAKAMSGADVLGGGAVITVQSAISAIPMATVYLPRDTSGLIRMVGGRIGGLIGLVVGVFPRGACPGAVVVTGTAACGASS
jgi:Fusaric acid resistance protein-like